MNDAATHPWGRIDTDGNVFVKSAEGERQIGQWQAGTPEEGLAMFTRRFDGLETEIALLEQRLSSGSISPDDAQKAVAKAQAQITEANAIGDLQSLSQRLIALQPQIVEARELRQLERAARIEEAQKDKEKIVSEAETIAKGTDWKNGADRLRELLVQWKALPRLSKSADDELWHRFSTARTHYTRVRKQHFTQQAAERDAAAKTKEKLIVRAEELSTSTQWGETSRAYRDLMAEWKKAGAAPRKIDDTLWKRFRAAQDAFFSARDEANQALDAEYEKNAEVKTEILAEAEKLLPITDAEAARKAWHDLADRWEAAGKVPRAKVTEFEARIRKVEQAVRSAGEQQWKRTDPEKSARADDMVAKLERAIAEAETKLAKATAAGDAKKVKDLTATIESNTLFLEAARRAQADYST